MTKAEVLRAIRDAEENARKIIAKSELEATDIITKARLSATEVIQSGKANSESASQGIISEARGVAEKEAKKVTKGGESSIDSIHNQSQNNRKKAVKIILDAFRSS